MLRDMKRMILTVIVALSTALAAAPAAFAGDPPPADPVRLVFEEANKAGADQVAQAKLLVRIELEIKANPKRPEAHFVRGFILSRMTKLPEALAAYDEATRLDPKFAEAQGSIASAASPCCSASSASSAWIPSALPETRPMEKTSPR